MAEAFAALPRFYIYPELALDHSAALECWPGWALDDQAAEAAHTHRQTAHS